MQSEAALVGLLMTGTFPAGMLLLVASAGNVLGSVVNWGIGRGIERFRERPWFPANPAMLDRAMKWYRRFGKWSLLLSWVQVHDLMVRIFAPASPRNRLPPQPRLLPARRWRRDPSPR